MPWLGVRMNCFWTRIEGNISTLMRSIEINAKSKRQNVAKVKYMEKIWQKHQKYGKSHIYNVKWSS
jgi:hypothetical protein